MTFVKHALTASTSNKTQKSTRPVNSCGRYFKRKFGEKVYKIPISVPGFTCPNIDGSVAKGGCIFCENESFSPNLQPKKAIKRFTLNPNSATNPILEMQLTSLREQYRQTKNRLSKKYGVKKFIIYFQSFTNTYAPLETLKVLYEEALSYEDVIGLSIGTRTDSITDEILDYLQEIQDRGKEVWVEYGIQSVYDATLEDINRGHDVESMFTMIERTKARNLKVCAHLIFGLPHETQAMMLRGVERVIEADVDSIKFHPMYVVKNTALTVRHHKGEFTPITEEAYIDTLIQSFKMLPDKIMVQRVSAGIDDATLLAPQWCRIKHNQINRIKKELLKIGLEY
jgi:radical SAM protein (TIGR01212 family)